MKNSILLGLVGSLMVTACGASGHASHVASASDGRFVCMGPITVRSQADVHSVAESCRAIDGDLLVVGTNVTSLDGLQGIHSVRYLVVAQNPKLRSVQGLGGLVSARGITFMDNPALESFSGLEGLAVTEAAVIANNGIRTLRGLGDLRSAREIVITGNPNLETSSGLAPFEAYQTVEVERNGANLARPQAPRSVSSTGAMVTQGDG
jgi:hypothetical protein